MEMTPAPSTATNPTQEVTPMNAANASDKFLSDRAVWVAAGRPADPSFAHWAGVLAAEAERAAGVRPVVEPLVVLG